MADRKRRGGSSAQGRLPYKQSDADGEFWARIAALWHRERMREVYEATGLPSHEARQRANREALDVAHRNGWRGTLPQLKASLAELVVRDLPGRGKLSGRTIRFWEEQVHADLLLLLTTDPDTLRHRLTAYLRDEVRAGGRLAGRRGFYRLSHFVGYVPSMDHFAMRDAFVKALSQIGHDPACCDRELFKVVMRLLRDYSRRPFETRLGMPMPQQGGKRSILADARRRLFGWLPIG